MARDSIELEGLTLDCVLGTYPEERDREQPVRVDLRMGLDLMPAGSSASIDDTIDYDRTCAEIAALLRFRRYRLLENAAHEVAAMLFGVHPAVEELELRVAKPQALVGRAQAAAIRIARRRGDFTRRRAPEHDGAEIEILLETSEAGLYLMHVAPGCSIPLHRDPSARELAWLVRGALRQEDELLPHRGPLMWPLGQAPRGHNSGGDVATMFRCECRGSPTGVVLEEVAQ